MPKPLKNTQETHPPVSVKEAMAKISKLTGIKRKQTQIRTDRKKMGCHKVGMLPSKTDVQEQEQLKKHTRTGFGRGKKSILLMQLILFWLHF